MISLDRLGIFIAIVDAGSLTAAAAVSEPASTMAMKIPKRSRLIINKYEDTCGLREFVKIYLTV